MSSYIWIALTDDEDFSWHFCPACAAQYSMNMVLTLGWMTVVVVVDEAVEVVEDRAGSQVCKLAVRPAGRQSGRQASSRGFRQGRGRD